MTALEISVVAVAAGLGVARWLREKATVWEAIDRLPAIPASTYKSFLASDVDDATIDRARAFIGGSLELPPDRLAPDASPAALSRLARPAGPIGRFLTRPISGLLDPRADGPGIDLTLGHLSDDLLLVLGRDFEFDPEATFAELVEALVTAPPGVI